MGINPLIVLKAHGVFLKYNCLLEKYIVILWFMLLICPSERLYGSMISDFEETDNLHLVQQLKEFFLQRTRLERIQFTLLNQG